MNDTALPSSPLNPVLTQGHRKPLVALAALASALCLTLGTVQSALWDGPEAPALPRLAARLLALPLESHRVFEQPGADYFAWGRWFWLVYASLFALAHRAPLPSPRLHRVVQLALPAGALGSLLAYGLSASLGPAVRRIGFLYLEVPAWIVLTLALTAQGFVGLRQGPTVRRISLALCLVLPVALSALTLLRYAPHAPAAAVCAGWAGVALWTNRQPSRLRLRSALARWALGVLRALLLAVPYRPIEITGPTVLREHFPRATPTAGLQLHVFNTGINRMSPLLVGDSPPWRPGQRAVG